jgi:hypothetical protein
MQSDFLSYQDYIKVFNKECSDFRFTDKGPIAKHNGVWYSVNGRRNDIVDVRYALREQELKELGIEL